MYFSHILIQIIVDGLLTTLENMKVKNIVIGKQFEDSENYRKCISLVKLKNIKTHIVEAGQRINIEDNLFFDILWPSSNDIVNENVLNNNSLVCKLVYYNFSMLFTGDIEEIAEKAIMNKYSKNSNMLRATVLKVAHHGSKTSSSVEILEAICPSYAFIGVGRDNKFGHPSKITIKNIETMGCKIYRTDEYGEITLKTNGKVTKITPFLELHFNK